MSKREFLGDCAIIMAGLVLFVIGVILQLIYPQGYQGQEPNKVILITELLMSLGILTLGIERTIEDRGWGGRELFGDVIIILSGFTLLGMFATITIQGNFMMYQVEPWFIIMRFVIAVVITILGIERFIDDIKNRG